MFRYYVIAILVCMLLIIAINSFFTPFSVVLGVTVICVLCAVATDALAALFTRYALPQKLFDPRRKLYRPYGWERKFYVAIGIRKWKDKIPESGGLLVNFPKTKVLDFHDTEYLFKFMEETCYAEVMHVLSIPLGFSALLLCPRSLALTVALPVALVNAVLQALPVFVQRFLRPQLMRIYVKNLNRHTTNS